MTSENESNRPSGAELSGFSDMPGSGRIAVVTLWILFAAGVAYGITAPSLIAALAAQATRDDPAGNSSTGVWLLVLAVITVLHLLVWTLMRGYFAAKLTGRSEKDRVRAAGFEMLGLALTITEWATLAGISEPSDLDARPEPYFGFTGIVVSAFLVALLNTKEMQAWTNG